MSAWHSGTVSSQLGDIDALRESVLRAWAESPTRFREDANAEEDLRLGGYRDRLLVELAQNASDAAGSGGQMYIRLDQGELRIANTGAPLTADGVAALTSLRASAKRHAVGEFGVGFAAVLSVTDEPRVVSETGGLAFSARATADAVAELPHLDEQVSAREGNVPILRLAWPVVAERPPSGYATDIRLPLRSTVDSDRLIEQFASEVDDLLLALPGLSTVDIGQRRWHREDAPDGVVRVHGPKGVRSFLVHRRAGEFSGEIRDSLRIEARVDPTWRVCWVVELSGDDRPLVLTEDVLHAPTPTDERLSLPARLIASVPIDPGRRRIVTGPATKEVLEVAATEYPALVSRFPLAYRPKLVPAPGFPLSEVDDRLRTFVLRELQASTWLSSVDGRPIAPGSAKLLDVFAPALNELASEAVDDLLSSDLFGAEYAAALASVGVSEIGVADVVRAVSGLRRPVEWWRRLYDALTPLADDPAIREELGGLPVPLADGRIVTGARDVLLVRDIPELAEAVSTLDTVGLRIADPELAHPLLERLGARAVGSLELLDSPPLTEAIARAGEALDSGADPRALADAVLTLVESSHTRSVERPWLSSLPLPDASGGWRPAGELVHPESPLLELFDDDALGSAESDAPLGVLAESEGRRWSQEALHAVGVLRGFRVIADDEPSGPDHELPEESEWWAYVGEPSRVLAVRDLDLVADDCWPRAISLLAAEPETWRAVTEPGGYTGWWLSRYALLAEHPPASWRLRGVSELDGLYEPVPDVGLSVEQMRAVGVRDHLAVRGLDDAMDLLDRLGDPDRRVGVATALRAHSALSAAVTDDQLDPARVDPPARVRTVSGAVATADRARVLDKPWLLGVHPSALLVATAPGAEGAATGRAGASAELSDTAAEALADLLDLPLASEEDAEAAVRSRGQFCEWSDVARVPATCALLEIPVPAGAVQLHDELLIRHGGTARSLRWWVDVSGQPHSVRDADGLGRALAWSAGAWSRRFELIALLTDPDPTTLLR